MYVDPRFTLDINPLTPTPPTTLQDYRSTSVAETCPGANQNT